MRKFNVSTEGQNRLGLRECCQEFVDEQWVVVQMTPEQAAEFVLGTFKRLAELELLVVEPCDVDRAGSA